MGCDLVPAKTWQCQLRRRLDEEFGKMVNTLGMGVNNWKKCRIFLNVFFALNLIIFMIKNCTKCLSSNSRRFSLHQNPFYFIEFLVIWWTYVFNWCNYLCIVEEFNRKTANSSHSGNSFCTPPEPAQLWRYNQASIVYPHLHDPYHVVRFNNYHRVDQFNCLIVAISNIGTFQQTAKSPKCYYVFELFFHTHLT